MGAFIAAVVIFGVTVRQNRLADSRSQARLFDAWVTTARWADYPEHSIGPVSQKLQVAIDCSNASGQSMRNVMADFLFANERVDGLYDLHLIPPTTPGNLERRWFWLLSVEQTSAESGIHRPDSSWLPQDEHDLHGCKRKPLDPHVER